MPTGRFRGHLVVGGNQETKHRSYFEGNSQVHNLGHRLLLTFLLVHQPGKIFLRLGTQWDLRPNSQWSLRPEAPWPQSVV